MAISHVMYRFMGFLITGVWYLYVLHFVGILIGDKSVYESSDARFAM